MRNKFTRSLALGMAFATAFTFTAPNTALFNTTVAEAAVAKKATKGTSKITASAKKVTVNVGKSKTVKVTLNKKQKKAVKVTLKSNKSAVAKVAKSVTVKKNAKTASFKITGKKAGTATITASFKTSKNKTKKATIKVTVKNVNDDNVVVNENKITINDVYGLQTDGTAYIGDVLQANISQDLGTVDKILWYRDGNIVKTSDSTGDTARSAFNIAGDYYAVAVTTKGTTYKSNTIKMTDTETAAVLKSFTLEDDYTDGVNVDFNTTDKKAVATITMNKNYPGKFILYKKADSKFSTKVDDLSTTGNAVGNMPTTGGAAGASVFIDAKTTNNSLFNIVGGAGVGYRNADGSVTYKFVADAGVARGTEYVVAFDQTSIATDTPATGKANVLETAATAPYVTAPASIEVTKVSKSNNPEVALYDADKNEMTWMGNGGNAKSVGLSDANLYSATSNTTSTTASGVTNKAKTGDATVKKGVITFKYSTEDVAYWFATIKTDKGIYGKDAITLTSAAKQLANDSATDITVRQNATNAATATVKFDNLRTSGHVYIVRGVSDAAATTLGADDWMKRGFKAFDEKDSNTYVGDSSVEAGTPSVDVANAIELDTTYANSNVFGAIFIPDDEANYGKVYTDTPAVNNGTTWAKNSDDASAAGAKKYGVFVEPEVKSYKIAKIATDAVITGGNAYCVSGSDMWALTSAATIAAAGNTGTNIFDAIDQFGDSIDHDRNGVGGTPIVGSKVITFTKATSTGASKDSDVILFFDTVAGAGGKYDSITLVTRQGTAANFEKGEEWTAKIGSQTITLKCDKTGTKDAVGLDTTAEWKISIS